LPPEELGVAAVALAAIAILESLREFGVRRYLIKEPDLTEDKIRTVFGIALLVSWSLAAAIFLSRHAIAGFYDEPRLVPIFALLAVSFLILPIGLPAGGLLRRDRRYRELSVIVLAATLANTVVSILVAWGGFGPIALAWGAVAQSVVLVALTLAYRRDHIRLRPSLKEWRAIGGFGGLSSLEAVISTLGSQLPQILMGKAFAFAAVGYYVRSYRLAIMVQRLFLSSVNWVTGTELGAMHRTGADMRPLLMKATGFTLVIAWPALLFMAIEAHAIIELLFGQAWAPAAPVLQALCVAQLLQVVMGQAIAVYIATGDVKLKLRNEVILQSIALGLLLVGLSYSVLVVAWLRVGFGLAHVVVHMTALRRYVGLDYTALGKTIARPAAVSALFALALLGLRLALPEAWRDHPLSVFPLAAAMTLVYGLLLVLFRHPLVHEITRLARRRLV
ncbi:MAG: oligosaccharide flippase family protein, partial [Rhodobacteraceae bacterium]|nr:oligosaccharide flippase family protein [Paracoccaceae bacterium]